MKKSHIVISDITCMKEKFCIAGFDTYEKRMKRLMIDGGYWDADQIPASYCEILVDNEEFKEPRDYPHRTEDVNIGFDSIEVLQEFEPGKDLANALRDSVSKIYRAYSIITSKKMPMCYRKANALRWVLY